MKTILILVFATCILLSARAEVPLEEIIRKRDTILSELLELAKQGHEAGSVTGLDVYEASIRLYSFRRDSAKSKADRIKWQELIVAAEKEMLSDIKNTAAIGVSTPKDRLFAEERLLA
ncbi:MAG: hypothetical protein EOP84_10595, partial [Verrucomicrobiaceae bacterium]